MMRKRVKQTQRKVEWDRERDSWDPKGKGNPKGRISWRSQGQGTVVGTEIKSTRRHYGGKVINKGNELRQYLARDIAHSVEVLAQHAEPWVRSPALQTSAVVVHTSNLGTEEVEARGSEVQNQPGLL